MAELTTDYAALANDIAGWLNARATQAGASRLVLGLSGGIDSAVVCGLAARAVGPDSVIAAILPINSLAQDIEDARAVAAVFGVAPLLIDLEPAFSALLTAMPQSASPLPLAVANVKPRLRMTSLYYLANQYDGLVVGTGNATELAIGYFTKYGDGGVDLLPLGNLNKMEVRALAREVGVPERVITKAPSAGLWEGQTDEAEIGLTYDALDSALGSLAAGEEVSVEPATRERVSALVAGSEHKRRPIPVFRRNNEGNPQ